MLQNVHIMKNISSTSKQKQIFLLNIQRLLDLNNLGQYKALLSYYYLLMTVTLTQIKAILWKSFLINFRTKQFIRQILSTLILGTFVVLIESNSPNNFISPFYISMAIIGYGRSVGFTWVQEKETYQKDIQNIMGISFFGYAITWLIYFILNALYVWGVMILFLYFGVVKNQGFYFAEGYTFFNLAFLYFVYALSTIGFILTLSTFFSKAKVAAQAMVFLQLILNFLYFLRFSQDYSTSKAFLFVSSLFPQVSFNFGISSIAFIQSNLPLEYTYSDSLTALSLTAIFYTLLAFYLEQVLPNAHGTNKHPLFFIKWICKSRDQNENRPQYLLQQISQEIGNYQHRAENDNPIISMKSVSKQFGQKVAVNKVTMNFFGNEIFCLLGHNGAGKSTTINLLTGLLKPTSGEINLMGLNYQEDIDQIRRNIGLCLQFNVLYEDLTIEEHLKFYALLKQMDPAHIDQDVEQTIVECSLANEKGKFVKNLSGGNKRKLSLANALIGRSKVIFLDEPSSGLDPNSRQGVWNIIKSVRNPQRCLILTTHHLEEAEELSQTIGIMADGKMIIVGDCNYIKDKFNVGFHVVLSFTEDRKQNLNECRKLILDNIEGAKEDPQTANNTIKFLLPQSQVKKFSTIFQKLENMCSLSVKNSNLQDAFIKLGEETQGEQMNAINDPDLQLPNYECSYSYTRQFKAVFYRKLTTTFRSFGAVVSILLPMFFITLGILISCLAISGDSPVTQWARRYVMSFFMVWAFIFNTSIYCGDLVLEREKKFKYLSHVLGLRKLPYWTANYAFDLLIFTIPLIVFFAVLFIIGDQAKFLTDVADKLVIILALFAVSFIGYSYLFSYMFQKSSTAFRLFPFFNMIFFFVIPTIPMNVKPESDFTQLIPPAISPFVAFFYCFFTKQIMGEYSDLSNFQSKHYTYNLSCLGIQAIVFITAALLIESLRFKLKDRQNLQYMEEQQAVQNRGSFYDADHINENDEIYISHLYKKYNNGFMAIRDNSFSVKKGEIFGLLGPNGAGKSTTFNIVTAALSKTAGTVNILNNSIDNGIMDIFSEFGVCPQYDSIYQNVTTEQHLYYVSRLKGVKQSQIANLIKYYFDLLSLNPYIKVKAGNLSGGNKRKLSVSMAMLANPKIMFFDEPSSGVDPISRRFLWKSLYLSARTKQASMVLTTHTMSEAESLCSRIGILIKGQFVTVATPSQLKMKYGKGFRVQIKYDPVNQNTVRQAVSKSFGAQVIVDKLQQNTVVFTIDNTKFSYSQAYNLFQNYLLQKKLIKRYEIKQSTLEQVFLFLSQMQPPVEAMEYKEPWQFCCWECGTNGCQWI